MSENNSFLLMENSLVSYLKPVQPNPDFINNLRNRLTRRKNIYIEERKHSFALMLISLGLFIGALIVWLLRKK
jgi:uncharacterized Tic20 family protein